MPSKQFGTCAQRSAMCFFKKTVFQKSPGLLGDLRKLSEKSPIKIAIPIDTIFFFLMLFGDPVLFNNPGWQGCFIS